MAKDDFLLTCIFIMFCVMMVGLATFLVQGVGETDEYTNICQSKFKGYENVFATDISKMEPGYLECCWTSYINHKKVISCEVIGK